MKKTNLLIIILLCLSLIACGTDAGRMPPTIPSYTKSEAVSSASSASTDSTAEPSPTEEISEETSIDKPAPTSEETPAPVDSLSPDPTETPSPESTLSPADPFSYAAAPAYSGDSSEPLNKNTPYFKSDEIFEEIVFSPLDLQGRARTAYGMLGTDSLPTEPRNNTWPITPAGWNNVRYEEIDGSYLFNRCHLIAWSLCGDINTAENIFTGTRYLNIQGMEPYERQVLDYINTTGNHVLYRVTPVYNGDALLPDGVIMEAQSVEDEELVFCVYCFNVQPGVTFDYYDGNVLESELTEIPDEIPSRSTTPSSEESSEPEPVLIGNANSHVLHMPECDSVHDMAEHNKVLFYGDFEEEYKKAVQDGYRACKRCRPDQYLTDD